LFGLPIGIIANGFVTGLSRRRFAVSWSMLRRQPLLQDLDVGALNEIIESSTAALVKEHAQITWAGKEALEFYLIIAGEARAEGQGGVQDLGPGEMIGAEALHHSAIYRQTVTAVSEMRVLAVPGDELRRLVRKYPVLEERIAQSAALVEEAPDDPAVRIRELENENAQLRRLLVDGLLQSKA
jgi:CRP-like cAMP-binding protein